MMHFKNISFLNSVKCFCIIKSFKMNYFIIKTFLGSDLVSNAIENYKFLEFDVGILDLGL
jgi:hypothetical protein